MDGKITAIITILLVVGILLGVSIYVLSTFQAQLPTITETITNETGAFINKTGYTVAQIHHCNWENFAVSQILNVTGSGVVPVGNYTVLANGTINNATTAAWPNVLVSYTYDWGGEACKAVNDTLQAVKQVPVWLPLVVILSIVGVILAIVFTVLPRSGDGTLGIGGGGSRGTVAEL